MGGGCSQALRMYFFSGEFIVQDFFGCMTFAGIFFNTTLELFLCMYIIMEFNGV